MGEKEREHDLTALRKEIATLVAEKCVDPTTQRPYPVGMIEKAMTEAGYSVKQNKNAKSQVSECIKLLQTDSKLPIQRARMRIKVCMPESEKERLKDRLFESVEKVESEEIKQSDWEVVSLKPPLPIALTSIILARRCSSIPVISVLSTSCYRRNVKELADWKPWRLLLPLARHELSLTP